MARGQLVVGDNTSREIVQAGLIDQQGGRWMQEVQGMMAMAARFPRNEEVSVQRMLEACKRKGFAAIALYSYPRGKENVVGPSIRLAEMMAQRWKNIEFGQTELEQTAVDSLVLAYAWDLESNVRQSRMFRVPHQRKADGRIVQLNDPRDIYEHVANMGARRMRAAILAVIPRDVQDACVEQVYVTQAGKGGEPIDELVRKSLKAFKDAFGVTAEMIQERFNDRPFDEFTPKDIVELRSIYQSLKEEHTTLATWWPDRFAAKPKSKSTVVKPNQAAPEVPGDDTASVVRGTPAGAEEPEGAAPINPDADELDGEELRRDFIAEAEVKMSAVKVRARIEEVHRELYDRAEVLGCVDELDNIAAARSEELKK